MDKRTDEKKARLIGSLEKGVTMIHLDARRPGVLVPVDLRGQAHLLLNLSYRFDPPDLAVGEWGIRSTLTFSGTRFTVAVPWSALYAISSHVTQEFWMYPDDMPRELLDSAAERRIKEGYTPAEAGSLEPRAILREVVEEHAESNDEQPRDPPEPPRRGHLRLVK